MLLVIKKWTKILLVIVSAILITTSFSNAKKKQSYGSIHCISTFEFHSKTVKQLETNEELKSIQEDERLA